MSRRAPTGHSFFNVRAFTMLELTVVLTVIGLLMAFAAPQFARARDAASVRSAMSDLTGAFSLARQTAVNRRALTAIVIDTMSARVTVRLPGEVIVVRDLGAAYGILLGATRDSAVYDAKGLAYGVSNLTVAVRRGAHADTLTMSRMGRVR
jgi:prepilin-type N-terminal cleavage/methylation domain-containing protein